MSKGPARLLRTLAVTFALLAAVYCYVPSLSQARQPRDLIMNEFESVAFTDGRFLFGPANSNVSPEIKRGLTTPFFGTIESLFQEHIFKNEQDKIRDVLLLARNFRRPSGLGINRFDACFIIRPIDSLEIGSFSKLAVAENIRGITIYSLQATPSPISIETSFFVARLKDRRVVIATTLELAKLAVEWPSTHSSETDPTKLVGLSEPPTGPLWLYRSYRTRFHSDPEVSGLILNDDLQISADASNLLFALSATGGNSTLRYVSSDSKDKTPYALTSVGFAFQQSAPFRWDAPIALDQAEETKDSLITIFGLFGFAVYI